MIGSVTWDRGVRLPEHGLWLDPHVKRPRALVSHAHSDHARRHTRAFMTRETLLLSTPARRSDSCAVVPYDEPFDVDGAAVTLLRSGHMLGSAQVFVLANNGTRLLYTGDLKLRPGGGVETPIPECDVLVIESTYGRPQFRFPDVDAALEMVVTWCRRRLADGVTPVLLATALGKAQELMRVLAPYGFRFALESRCARHADAYRRAGAELPDHVRLDPDDVQDRVVIAPPAGKDEVRRLNRYRCALVSGWALDAHFWPRLGADAAIPLSDHCDFDELVEVVRRSRASLVYTVHGFASDLAKQLRKRSVQAWPLAEDEQLQMLF